MHEWLTQVARRKERFCDWVANWARGIDEDPSPIASRECVFLGALGVLSPAPAFSWSCAYSQASMSLWSAVQPPRHASFFGCSPLGMDTKPGPSLLSRPGTLKKC